MIGDTGLSGVFVHLELYSWCIATSVRNIISGMVWILLSRNSSALWMEIERQWICGCGYTFIKLC